MKATSWVEFLFDPTLYPTQHINSVWYIEFILQMGNVWSHMAELPVNHIWGPIDKPGIDPGQDLVHRGICVFVSVFVVRNMPDGKKKGPSLTFKGD